MSADELVQRQPATHGRITKRQRGALVLLVLLAIAAAWWLSETLQTPPDYLVASGTIEAEEVTLAAEVGGRVRAFDVGEGQAVSASQVLATIDIALLEAQAEQARAAVGVARANAALVEAGPREEEIRQLQSAVTQAAAARDGARKAWENAEAALADPQELDAKIAVARPQVVAAEARLARLRAGATEAERDAARAAVAMAQARLDEALRGPTPEQLEIADRQLKLARNQEYLIQQQTEEYSRRVYGAPPGTPPPVVWSKGMGDAQLGIGYEQTKIVEAQVNALVAPPTAEQVAQLQAAVDQAAAQLQRLEQGPTAEEVRIAEMDAAAAQANLDGLLDMRANPRALRAQVDVTLAQFQAAGATLAGAQARLDAAEGGATAHQLAAAMAQVRQAEAALSILEVQMAKADIVTPMDGIVVHRLVNAGESVMPGTRLLTIANLDVVHLVIYVPETRIGRIILGQEVEVVVDSYPGRTFAGTVVHIADRAEYTPRNVQSPRERANTVFAVKVSVSNADRSLKPGMPADATLRW